MTCPQCGSSLPDNAPFCSVCGRTATSAAGMPAASLPGTPVGAIPQTSRKAIISLVLGILPLSFLSSIPAVVFGHIALSEIKKSGGRLSGTGMAIAGLVLGYLGIALIPFVLIVAAIAIPNLLRARIAANEASAVSSIRTINTAEFSYRSTYPQTGYARDLLTLGPDGPNSCATPSLTRSCLIDYRLSSAIAAPGKAGYIFTLEGAADGSEYLVAALPAVHNQTGVRSFCSVEDGLIHFDSSGSAIANRAACGALPVLE